MDHNTTALTAVPFVADIMSFEDRVNNAIYRMELKVLEIAERELHRISVDA
jgi:hypothetical protein